MKIYLSTDHAGFTLKEHIKAFLSQSGYDIEDCSAFSLNKDDDYPDFVYIAAQKVAQDPASFGVIFGKSGAGEAIVANKVHGIRAVVGFNHENVKLSREHNNANILSLGSAFVSFEQAEQLIKLFLETPFSNQKRHKRRIQKIHELENR